MGHAQTEGILRTGMSIDTAHKKIHDGKSYLGFTHTGALGDTETMQMCWKTPDTGEWHMIVKYDTKVAAHVELLEGPQWSGGQTGTNAAVFNRNRQSANVSTLLTDWQSSGTFAASGAMHVGVSGLSGGTQIWDSHAYAIKRAPGIKDRGQNEIDLQTGTKYAVRLTSDAASNAAHLQVNWYEK